MFSEIKICIFNGKTMRSYIPSIARLSIEVLKDYPYLEERTLEEEIELLEKLTLSDRAIGVVVFDGSKIVGISTGLPLWDAPLAFRNAITHVGFNASSFFFFSESLLLKKYRGRGIAHHFYDLREEHALQLGYFDHMGFCCVLRDEHDPKRPKDYIPLNDFWHKRGYVPHAPIAVSKNPLAEEKEHEPNRMLWTKALGKKMATIHQMDFRAGSDKECSSFAEALF